MVEREHVEGEYETRGSVDELTRQNIRTVARIDDAATAGESRFDRIAESITNFCGSPSFIWAELAFIGGWMGVNSSFLPDTLHFDPPPYLLLNQALGIQALFLAIFILVSQNRQARLAERRNHLDLQINLLSEQENTKMLMMLDAISKKLDIPDGDPDVEVLTRATEPDKLAEQIEEELPSFDSAKQRRKKDGIKRTAY